MPWSSKIVVSGRNSAIYSIHGTIVDNVIGCVVCSTSGSSDTSLSDGADVDLVEPGGGSLSEDEVYGSCDETLGVKLVSGVG